MSAVILDSKPLVKELEENVKEAMLVRRALGVKKPARLAILTDHSDAASEIYMERKVKAAKRCSIEADIVDVPTEFDAESLGYLMEKIIKKYDGIILQLPVENQNVKSFILARIPASADVDGLCPTNTYLIHTGGMPLHAPCTPEAVVKLLLHYKINLAGAHVVIVGRSYLVGRPLAELLLQADSTVTVCHTKTKGLSEITKQADILVVAAGAPGLITSDMVKPGSVVVDVGINRVDGKVVGDVDFEAVKEVAGYITPVPGGIGPITVATLMLQVARASCMVGVEM